MSQPTQSPRVSASFNHGNPTIRFGNDHPIPADAAAINRARALRANLLPRPLGLAPSFGFGDRLGLATPGHVAAMRNAGKSAGIQPIFAQQSIREMTRTQRSPQQVMDDATLGALVAGWDGIVGADADHLKTTADVDSTAAALFCFFTLDPSGEVDARADDYAPRQLEEAYEKVAPDVTWLPEYVGKR